MSDKYIIKNCPNYDDYFYPNETCRKKYSQYCQDCTDCLLKQIVQILEKEPIILDVNKEFEQMYKLAKVIFAKEILAKLDIERVE